MVGSCQTRVGGDALAWEGGPLSWTPYAFLLEVGDGKLKAPLPGLGCDEASRKLTRQHSVGMADALEIKVFFREDRDRSEA